VPKICAAMVGAMHIIPTGLRASAKACASATTSGSALLLAPSVAKLERFFAAPKPPGMISASKSSARASRRSLISPRARRADSVSTLRDSGISSPVR
jgi:hypothetical protein